MNCHQYRRGTRPCRHAMGRGSTERTHVHYLLDPWWRRETGERNAEERIHQDHGRGGHLADGEACTGCQHGRAGLGSLESSNLGNILNYTIKRRDVEGGRKEGGERGTERGTKT